MTSDGIALPPPPQVVMTWTLPEGWSEIENVVPMRFATLIAGDPDDPATSPIEVSVTQLGGIAGGIAANINRWRGQIGLPPASDEDLQAQAVTIEAPGAVGVMVDLVADDAGDEDPRMLAAIFPGGSATWFFKATAPNASIEVHRAAFEELCRTVDFTGDVAPHPAMTTPTAPTGSPAAPIHDPDAPVAWDSLPSGWTVDVQPAAMSVASMTVMHAGGTASMTITPLGGTQDPLANINRWRGQVGLGAATSLEEAGAVAAQIDGSPGTIVDVAGPEIRTLGAMTVRDGTTWFFKLTGPDAVVGPQAAVFDAFVRSVHFHDHAHEGGG